MSDFLKKWIWGVAGAWGIIAGAYLLVKLKVPLPSTDDYLAAKHANRAKELELLAQSEKGIDALIEERRRMREEWHKVRIEDDQRRATEALAKPTEPLEEAKESKPRKA